MTNHLRSPEPGEQGALNHVTLLAFRPEVPAFPAGFEESPLDAYYRIERELIHAVRVGGGTVLSDDGTYDLHDQVLTFNANAYTYAPSQSYAARQLQRLPERAPNVRLPKTTALLDAHEQAADFPGPYVLADTKLAGGIGKYLVETEEQHNKVLAYADYHHEDAHGIQTLAGVVMREYIETPSEYFTSYRIVATPDSVVAAGLLYSVHTKAEAKAINTGGSELSSPDSPFYLASRDVRSNVALGGSIIPLMGENREHTSSKEREILAAHGIDPNNPAVPAAILEQTPSISRNYGRVIDVHYGIDFIGDGVFLECNGGPGLKTYEACHTPPGASPDYGVIYASIYNQVLADMQAMH